jgi:hypothetical protein
MILFLIVNCFFNDQVALYETPDKPNDALSFLRNNFVGQDVKELQEANETLKAENQELVNNNFANILPFDFIPGCHSVIFVSFNGNLQ